ncbi:MAG TPA: zinc-binding dehydrogenase, partial [Chthoniobacterales bacterium]
MHFIRVGAVVGQIAKLKGARVVGIAGGADKCRYAVEELGFDVCLDRHDPQLAEYLAAACPDGIDVYFENVGGAVFDAVLPLLNIGARVPVCGHIGDYNNGTLPPGPNRLPLLMSALVQKRIRMEGFIILDHYADRFAAFRHDMSEWIGAGRVKLREDVVDGLEDAPEAFMAYLRAAISASSWCVWPTLECSMVPVRVWVAALVWASALRDGAHRKR